MAEQYSSLQDLLNVLSTDIWHIQISRYVTVAGYVVMVYDHMTTFSDEVELIWQKPISLVSCLFLFNRYLVPIVGLIDLWQFGGLARNVSNKFCHDWLIVDGAFQTLCQAIAHFLACLRVRALLSAQRWVDWLLLVCGILYFIGTVLSTSMVLAYVDRDYAWNSTVNFCVGTMPPWMAWAWAPGLVFETILFGLLISKAYRDWRRDLSFPITRVLYRDGFISFLVISSCSIFNIVAWSALPDSLVALAKNFSFCIIVTMSCRIVLNLRDLRRRPEDGYYLPRTDMPLELGSVASGKSRTTRRGTRTNAVSGKDLHPKSSSAFGRSFTTSKNDGWDHSMTEMPPVSVTVQVDVHREVDVDELHYDSDDRKVMHA
ncbi:hypothetical protein FRC04_004464 [Tulasnella sp. 424]|nr:hypothetical protein FRC04_004464 [Tulasnella sp. 424]